MKIRFCTDTAWFPDEKSVLLPKIPVTPLAYADAVKYLARLGGKAVKSDWKGGLNITYRYGPGFSSAEDER